MIQLRTIKESLKVSHREMARAISWLKLEPAYPRQCSKCKRYTHGWGVGTYLYEIGGYTWEEICWVCEVPFFTQNDEEKDNDETTDIASAASAAGRAGHVRTQAQRKALSAAERRAIQRRAAAGGVMPHLWRLAR